TRSRERRPSGPPPSWCSTSDALARLFLCVLELLLALADLLLGLALLLAELVVGQLALLLLELAFDFVSHAFHGDPFRLAFGAESFPVTTRRKPTKAFRGLHTG